MDRPHTSYGGSYGVYRPNASTRSTRREPSAEDVRLFAGCATFHNRGRHGLDVTKIPTFSPGPAYNLAPKKSTTGYGFGQSTSSRGLLPDPKKETATRQRRARRSHIGKGGPTRKRRQRRKPEDAASGPATEDADDAASGGWNATTPHSVPAGRKRSPGLKGGRGRGVGAGRPGTAPTRDGAGIVPLSPVSRAVTPFGTTSARWSPLMWNTLKDNVTPNPDPSRQLRAQPGPGAYQHAASAADQRRLNNGGDIGRGVRDKPKDPSYYLKIIESPGPCYEPMASIKFSKKQAPIAGMGRKIKFGSYIEESKKVFSPGPVYSYSVDQTRPGSPKFSFAPPSVSPRAQASMGYSLATTSVASTAPLGRTSQTLGEKEFYRGEETTQFWETTQSKQMRDEVWHKLRSQRQAEAEADPPKPKLRPLSYH